MGARSGKWRLDPTRAFAGSIDDARDTRDSGRPRGAYAVMPARQRKLPQAAGGPVTQVIVCASLLKIAGWIIDFALTGTANRRALRSWLSWFPGWRKACLMS